MSDSYIPRPGLNYTPAYQASGIPFLSSNIAIAASGSGVRPVSVCFYNVTKFITIKNEVSTTLASAPLYFGFSEAGLATGSYFISLNNGESYSGDLKVSYVYLMAGSAVPTSASIAAGLTSIPSAHCKHNWTGSVGVG